jgi:hypothetical protein
MNIKRIGVVAASAAAAAVLAAASATPVISALASDPVPVHAPNGNPVDGGPAHLQAFGDPDDGGQISVHLAAFGDPDDGGQLH